MFKDKALHKELSRLISQIEISTSHIDFKGKRHLITDGNAIALLTGLLYAECYMLKESFQLGELKKPEQYSEDTGFINLLSQNNLTKEKTEQDWKVKHTYPNGYAEITRNNENRIVNVSSISADGTETVSVFFPKEDRHRQPVFYYAFSNEFMDTSKKMVRIYWNCTSEGAPVLLKNITAKLNHYNIPFLFKCLNHPGLYFRRDAAVLYIEDNHMPVLEFLLSEICEAMNSYCEDDVPLFSYHYSKGVGIAENPNMHESFGMNRMALVAEALLKSSLKRLQPDETLNAIAAAFAQKGINPSATFLNKGSRILFN